MIVTSRAALRRKCEPVRDAREGGEIARKLFAELARVNKRAVKRVRVGKAASAQLGVGLAAPQIGIHKRVCVVSVGSPLVLMNPVIVGHSSFRVPYQEGCLSFPGKVVDTWRYIWVKVEALNHPGVLTIGPTDPEGMRDGDLLLRSVVAQHEIAHLFGLLFFDFRSEDYPPPAEWEGWKPDAADAHAGKV